jgi:hypothetical protein
MEIMKKNKYLVATIAILIYLYIMFSFIGCTTTKYVPIESVRTEYINKVEKDTVIINNDRLIKEKGDTIYIVNTKYVYKTKNKIDTILRIDTIPIIQEVEVIKEVNRIKDWQMILMLLGGGMVAVIGYKVIRLCGI